MVLSLISSTLCNNSNNTHCEEPLSICPIFISYLQVYHYFPKKVKKNAPKYYQSRVYPHPFLHPDNSNLHGITHIILFSPALFCSDIRIIAPGAVSRRIGRHFPVVPAGFPACLRVCIIFLVLALWMCVCGCGENGSLFTGRLRHQSPVRVYTTEPSPPIPVSR